MRKEILLSLVGVVIASGCLGSASSGVSSLDDRAEVNRSLEEVVKEPRPFLDPFQLQYVFRTEESLLSQNFRPRLYYFNEDVVYEIDEDSEVFYQQQLIYRQGEEYIKCKLEENQSTCNEGVPPLKGYFSVYPERILDVAEDVDYRGTRKVAGRKCIEFRINVSQDFDGGFAGSENKRLDTCLDAEYGYVAHVHAYSEGVNGERLEDWVYTVEKLSYGVPVEVVESNPTP